jgi:4-aminobutyrate aminotransferase-like enzyme
MTTSVSANAEWLERAAVLAGRTLTGYRLPPEVDFVVDHGRGARVWDLDGRPYVDLDATGAAFGEALAEAAGRG